MNFVTLTNMPFLGQLRRLFSRWQGFTLSTYKSAPDTPSTAPAAANSIALPDAANTSLNTNPDTSTPPNTHMTPRQWLAQQPPDSPCFIYINHQTREMMELLSVPREQVNRLFNCLSYRDASQWMTSSPQRLRCLDSASDFAQQMDNRERLEALHSARCFNSTEMHNLDVRILNLWEQVSTLPTSSTETAILLQLATLLAERQRASLEMVQLDQALLPLLQKLGIHHV